MWNFHILGCLVTEWVGYFVNSQLSTPPSGPGQVDGNGFDTIRLTRKIRQASMMSRTELNIKKI
jgi:hypothetical protein